MQKSINLILLLIFVFILLSFIYEQKLYLYYRLPFVKLTFVIFDHIYITLVANTFCF